MNSVELDLVPYVYECPTERTLTIIHFDRISKRPYLSKMDLWLLTHRTINQVDDRLQKYSQFHGYRAGTHMADCYIFGLGSSIVSNGQMAGYRRKPVYPAHMAVSVFDYFNSRYYGDIQNPHLIRNLIGFGVDCMWSLSPAAVNRMKPFTYLEKMEKENKSDKPYYIPDFLEFVCDKNKFGG